MATYQDSSHPTGVKATGSNEKAPRGEVVAIRNRKQDAALELKLAGHSWSTIAQAVGYPTPRAAQLAVEKSLVRRLDSEEDKSKMRSLAGQRLNRLLAGIWDKATDPDAPEQMVAVSRARELIADHTKLFGYAAPTELTIHTPTQSELEDWVHRMTSTMVPNAEEADIWDGEVVDDEALGA